MKIKHLLLLLSVVVLCGCGEKDKPNNGPSDPLRHISLIFKKELADNIDYMKQV